jgi:hypothetical protein
MRKLFIVVILITILLGSCQKEDTHVRSKPGYFVLTEIRNAGIKSTQSTNNDSIKTVFNLGDLKNSKEFYFIISNGGDNPIFDVNLKTDNPQINVSPENISFLPGKDSNGSNTIIPLIALEVVHGSQLNGVGYAKLLPMGENLVTLSVTGKTMDDKDTINLASEFYFKLSAKVMDIRLFENEQEINLLNPVGSVAGVYNSSGLDFIPYYHLDSDSVQIQNIGNVEINLKIGEIDIDGKYTESGIISIAENQSSQITIKQQLTIFVLTSNGTITDASRIQLGNDGNGYIAFEKYAK